MAEFKIKGGGRLEGELTLPGDKSISHRCIIFAALAEGKSQFENLSTSADVRSTISVLRKCGVKIVKEEKSVFVEGTGKLKEPVDVLNCGNSGTTARLMTGVLASQLVFSVLTGDASLRRRPMKRVVSPLRKMGAHIWGRSDGEYLPLAIRGQKLRGISYASPTASAQVKTSLILAGIFAEGVTEITEPSRSRDHTEKLLPFFGVEIYVNGLSVKVKGPQKLHPFSWELPGDISSAAFFIAAAVCLPGSHIIIRNVLLNPTRMGFVNKLKEMGAKIKVKVKQKEPEPSGDIEVVYSELRGVKVKDEEIPSLIDELPLLALVASVSEGVTEIRGAGELRVKESDRIKNTVRMLRKFGATVKELPDGMVIHGGEILKGSVQRSFGDHRIAMTAVVGGAIARGMSVVKNFECVRISFPEFENVFRRVYVR